jgi:nucleoside 2-deoxyribosyltransferase
MPTTRKQIFVIQPFDKSSDGLYELIRGAAAIADVNVTRADMGVAAGSNVVQSIKAAIGAASLIIADVTGANPNVMYEVGFAQAQNKPLLLIANSSRSIPFDLAGVRVVIYDLAHAEEFVGRLANSVTEALRDPEAFLFARVTAEREKHRNVFISYSHSDRDYLDRLLVHLKPLERDGLIDLWVDTRLRAGDRWKKEIEKALNRANVSVLLVSADFLASDFITDNELPPLLKSAEEKGMRIVPLIVKPCRFTRDKNLRHFQAINDPKRSLALLSEGEQELLYDQVAAEVERSLQRR